MGLALIFAPFFVRPFDRQYTASSPSLRRSHYRTHAAARTKWDGAKGGREKTRGEERRKRRVNGDDEG